MTEAMPESTVAARRRIPAGAVAGALSSADRLSWTAARRARLVRLCTAIVRDKAAAEDLAQETLLEAWRHRHKLTDPGGADPWLNAIARNVCRRYLTSRRLLPVPTADPEPAPSAPCTTPDLDAVLERQELIELLERALALLAPETRRALVAHYVEERTHAEIADQLGTSADAVSMRVSRGKARLRFLLETRFAEDAVAESWIRRDDPGWRPSRLRCIDCGSLRVEFRHARDEVAFRCDACDPFGLSVRLPLDTPAFSSLVGHLRRPSAIAARTAAWSIQYWRPTQRPGQVRCVRCDRWVAIRPYVRADGHSWSSRNGWYADCDSCGEQVSGSIAGLALAQPEVRAARRQEPRLRSVPVRDVWCDGLPAKLVGFARPDGVETASAVFLRDTLRLVHVSASPTLHGLTTDGG